MDGGGRNRRWDCRIARVEPRAGAIAVRSETQRSVDAGRGRVAARNGRDGGLLDSRAARRSRRSTGVAALRVKMKWPLMNVNEHGCNRPDNHVHSRSLTAKMTLAAQPARLSLRDLSGRPDLPP